MTERVETMVESQSDLERFIERAEVAAAKITRVRSYEEAVAYTVDLCGKQGACRLQISGCEENLSEPAEDLCETKHEKIIAAPGLNSERYEILEEQCRQNGFACIDSGIRSHLAGVDIGFTFADLAIAETGTVVLNCPSEELRIATMICEYHVCVLEKSKIVTDAFAAEPQLQKFMRATPNYTAFITGPSRTADIERVLTIGVHGPLELHILLLED